MDIQELLQRHGIEGTDDLLRIVQGLNKEDFVFTAHVGGTPWDVYRVKDRPLAVAVRIERGGVDICVMGREDTEDELTVATAITGQFGPKN